MLISLTLKTMCYVSATNQTPAQAVADIAATDTQVFTVLDALKGYHQCLLDEQSQLFTVFITPLGA